MSTASAGWPEERRVFAPWLIQAALLLYFDLIFLVSFTQAERWLGAEGLLPVDPTQLFPLLAAPLLALVAVQEIEARRPRLTLQHAVAANVAIVGPFVALAVCHLLATLRPEAYWGEGIGPVLLVPYDCAIFLVALVLGLCPPFARRLRWLGTLAVLVLAATIAVDFAQPAFFAKIPSRPAGIARDANTAAFLLVLGAGLALSYRRLERRDLAVLAVAGLGVAATLSRAGLLLFCGLLAIYALKLVPPERLAAFRLGRLLGLAAMALALAAGFGLAAYLVNPDSGVFSLPAAQARLEMLTGKVSFLAGQNERLGLMQTYWQEILRAPFLGRGAAFSYAQPQGPHVRYLQEWVNAGLPALIAYVALLAGAFFVFHRRHCERGTVAVLVIAAGSFFSHGILEQRGVPIVLGLLASASLQRLQPEGCGAGVADPLPPEP